MRQDLLGRPGACPEYRVRLDDGRQAAIRELRPEDERLYPDFAAGVSGEDHRLRFFSPAGGLSPARVHSLTHFDREDARAFVATEPSSGRMLGVGRVHRGEGREGEFAVLVRSDLKGRGLGRELMEAVLSGAEALGLRAVWGLVLRENAGMIELGRDLGFAVESLPGDPGLVRLRRELRPPEV